MRERKAWVTWLRSERGGISAEYVALLALVVLVLAAIPYAEIDTAVRDEIEDPICAIATDRELEGGCGGDGERPDTAARDDSADRQPGGEQARGLGLVGARRAAGPGAQAMAGSPPASSQGEQGGGATLLPVATVRPPAESALVGPVVKKLVQEIGKRLFGTGRKPPAARPAPPKPPSAGSGRFGLPGKPAASNPALRRTIDELYRPRARVGTGSTADAIRFERSTGKLLSPSGHSIKGRERISRLESILRTERLSTADRRTGRALIDDLKDALATKPPSP